MLSLFGNAVKAVADAFCSVHLHVGAKCKGGVQIAVPERRTILDWLAWNGVEVEDGHALLFKAVDDAFRSPRQAIYTPGTETVAPDWDCGKQECGKGLHFSCRPVIAKTFNESATKFVACLVPVDVLAFHPEGDETKVKAQRCWNFYECDLHGDVIGEKHPRPKPARAATKKPAKKKSATKRRKN